MTTTTLRNTGITLAAALLMVGTTNAAITASASVTDFSITLIDTDLSDGVTPTITFNDPYGYGYGTYVSSQAQSSDWYQGSVNDYKTNYGTFQNSFLQESSTNAGVMYASTQVETTSKSIVMSASADFYGSNAQYSPYYYAHAGSSAQPQGWWGNGANFTLSANTLLLVQGDYSLAVHVDGAAVSNSYGYYDNASASYSIQGSLNIPGSQQQFYSGRSLCAYNYAASGCPVTDGATGSFYGALFNGGATSLDGALSMSVSVSVIDYTVTPVPEANVLALALAGLGVCGAASRRCKG